MVIITALTSPNNPGKWQTSLNSTHPNDTEEYAMAAIGQYVLNRNSVGVDKTGHVKHKW